MKILRSGHGLFFLLLVVTAIIYFPATDSRFLLDDFSSLDGLKDVKVYGYSFFTFSGSSGPSGRPVSLMTFALQHSDWPGNPFSFKLVNLIIHLFNGILVYLLTCLIIDRTSLDKKYYSIFSLLTSFLWLIQPIQISAVLYTVQRMTLLSAFFSLTGILVYLYCWKRFNTINRFSELLIWSVLFCICLVLAVFSKENGILLPGLILIIEFTLLQSVKRPKIWNVWTGIFLVLPLVLLVCYLIYRFDYVIAGYQSRSFTMAERLLTEARILFVYLYNIVLPHPSAFGLYHDDFTISTGLFAPPSTFISVTGIAMLAVSGIAFRRTLPVVAFSVLWYLGAHLLESTYLSLELYFEHRNYLACYGICFLIAFLCLKIPEYIKNRLFGILLVTMIIISPVVVTMLEVNLWSKPIEQALEWQRRSPFSQRAREDIGNLYINFNDSERALDTYQRMTVDFPDDIYPYIKIININACLKKKEITEEEWILIMNKAYSATWHGLATIAEINALIDNLQKGKCKTINVYYLIKLILILAHNPEYFHHNDMLHELAAYLNMVIGETEAALNNINTALLKKQTASRHMLKIKILINQNERKKAGQAIMDARKLFNKHPRWYLAYGRILSEMERKLEKMTEYDNVLLPDLQD